MDIRKINDDYSVSPQIEAEDVDIVSLLGFRSIVCHRPDYEQPDQPEFASIAARARELGIEARHIPVAPSGLTAEALSSMTKALAELPGPVLAYCRSGARSTKIFEQALLPL
ncbi:TIGR01244 family sulfur transferase [Shinella curvata]|uniref:TIGR01244 family sulfur transferase n=1 Tax=Shinella curvata TaxID=1817964 RepID=A0ABT8XAY9_9HYPH|nr:TIGR01244 family sulfur transferase [Shinella curvata]MCJ8054709.1 TIGR01244 family sulfur transferase [Shinella curvata]MDO6120896.1 TIGR01244 family sulfur transferase [Shinella curvata]